jgi:thymidylate synthase (FAD)
MVDYINHMGDDDTVCNAARVSMDKTADMFSVNQNAKLIAYLAKHNHWSPFAHCTLQLRFTAPIFVARQLAKHQIGFAWNEVSRRYVDSKPSFWLPDSLEFRKRADNVKQGSSDEIHPDSARFAQKWEDLHMYSEMVYNDMIYKGVCPEQARAILPQTMITQWMWTGSLYAWSRMFKLRIDPHAQREVQSYAQQVGDIATKYFPLSWNALTEV